jgi:hypothetical protein
MASIFYFSLEIFYFKAQTFFMDNQQLFDGCLVIDPCANLHEATADMPATAGISLFTDNANQPILLLYGANLRAQVRRRLGRDDQVEKSRKTQLRPIVRRIWFRRNYSAFETQISYFNIAREVYPDTYRDFFPRLDVWFVRIKPESEYPFFSITSQIRPEPELYWGPFATKKSADGFLTILQDIFDLCRCPHLLNQGCDAASCSYAQMNRCAAARDGTILPELYRRTVNLAIEFLNRPLDTTISEMKQEMEKYAAKLKYEQAQRTKKQIELARKLLSPNYRWVVPLDKFHVLSFQPGPLMKKPHQRAGLPSVSTFLLSLGGIRQIEPYPLDQVQPSAQQILDHFNLLRMQELNWQFDSCSMELCAWIAQQLYRNSSDKGLFLPVQEDISVDLITQKLQEHFTLKPGKKNDKDKNKNEDEE